MEGLGGQLGRTATAGHDVVPRVLGIRLHGSFRAKAFHEAVVNFLFPVPKQGMRPKAHRPPEQPGFVDVAAVEAQ